MKGDALENGQGGAEDLIADAIGRAEGISDPLDGLKERVKDDPGAAFTDEVVAALARLKKENLPAFETLRTALKKSGCRVTVLDKAIAREGGDAREHAATQSDILVDIAQSSSLFHAPDGTGFADLDIKGHRETWPIRSRGYRLWLSRCYFEKTNGAPSSEALQASLNVTEAKARFDGPEWIIHNRVSDHDGCLYLDLCDDTWRAIEIDVSGWRVIDNPPVRFYRSAGMKSLPLPIRGGTIEMLRPFLNVQSDTDFVLAVAWLVAALRNRGPYPVLVLAGEQGSAKSTTAAILRALVDPNVAPLRALSREDRELFIAAGNAHVQAFDNISGLPTWISDTLCRLATGGGFAVRQLYTDQDEVLFEAVRPVILNGIEDIVTRPDLADRALFLTLQPIPEESRKPETEIWAKFEAARPFILGVLLDAVSHGLKHLPQTRLEKVPRMADFAYWASACETGLWSPGTFLAAYSDNRDCAIETVINADPVGVGILEIMKTRTMWTGTASDLLGALNARVDEQVRKSKSWPNSAHKLSGRVRRLETFLRKTGIEISHSKEGHGRARTIWITKASNPEPETGGM